MIQRRSVFLGSQLQRRAQWRPVLCLLMLSTLLASTAHAEQMKAFGPWQFHYIVLPTKFLQAKTAQSYGIVRGEDRALINVSIIHTDNGPTPARVEGEYINLLSQRRPLEFREVREGEAVYYLAEIKHTDRDTLRFELSAWPEGAGTAPLEIKVMQRMYVERDD